MWEEVGVRPTGTWHQGTLRFQFTDGLRLQVEVFFSSGGEGAAVETDEAVPLWVPVDRIPYDEMWADDRVWLPEALAGRWVDLWALFEEDAMLGHRLETREAR